MTTGSEVGSCWVFGFKVAAGRLGEPAALWLLVTSSDCCRGAAPALPLPLPCLEAPHQSGCNLCVPPQVRYHSDTQSLKIAQGVSGTGALRPPACLAPPPTAPPHSPAPTPALLAAGRHGCCRSVLACHAALSPRPCPCRPGGHLSAPALSPPPTLPLHLLAVRDKGSVRRNVPFLVQAVKQGFQARMKCCRLAGSAAD